MKLLELLNHGYLVVAHRGARRVAPENTLLALKQSRGRFDFVEVDVCLSRDKVVVVIHDDTLQRTTNIVEIDSFRDKKPYRVCDFTLDELSMLDYGSWFYKDKKHKEPLLTLKKALEFIQENDMYINVEIKDISNCFEDKIVVEAVAKEIEDVGVGERVLLSSFKHSYLREAKKRVPNILRGALFEGGSFDNLLECLKELEVDACHLDAASVDEKRIRMIKEAGYKVGVYTVNSAKRSRALFEIGVNYIFSDSLDKNLKKYAL
ncbi:glycerophosphodiester phosphodiesterase family protein [Sulfurimonas sp.]|jgi:glycerophosphoryl diester phosphodiesterase|uniref:glycerophosphodiester phosphodiesterase n=1 Tax=Sulfurimonas sp. TaxID=2022749 RepID=UPI0025FF60DC|nr:glycerophosphodiester phosphodiesterase family protein [Sulfurimonas sp.]MCK9473924.1 glycerophosphodiester phosphodiesterase [Sulfurimonas sp.]MDD3506366.1 glycerophosphodiester phosphodiesterase family protein [Sulfurimonas sp.]